MRRWLWKLKALVALTFSCLPHSGRSTTPISDIQIQSAAIAGKPLKVVINSGDEPFSRCGFRLDYGNGDGRDLKVDETARFPFPFEITYPVPGRYVIKAEGKKVTSALPCLGRAETIVDVKPAPAVSVEALGTNNTTIKLSATCPQIVTVKNADGKDVQFGLRQMIADAGGVLAARELISKRVIDAQTLALNEATGAEEKAKAKSFAESLLKMKMMLAACE